MMVVSLVLVLIRASDAPQELPTQRTSAFLSVPMRRGPDHTVAIDVHGHGAADRGHVRGRLINGDLLRCGVEMAQAAATRIDVEPEVTLRVPDQPVTGGRFTVRSRHLQIRDLPGPA